MLTRKEIQGIAGDVLKEHGLLLLKQMEIGGKQMDGGGFGGGNLIALMEIFAERIGGERDEAAKVIDAHMGIGWTRNLAESLMPPNKYSPER